MKRDKALDANKNIVQSPCYAKIPNRAQLFFLYELSIGSSWHSIGYIDADKTTGFRDRGFFILQPTGRFRPPRRT